MKTLAEINAILGTEIAADLTAVIAAIKAAVRASEAGVISDLQAQLADQATEANLARQAAAESHAAALAAKDVEKAAAVEAEGKAVHARLDALVQAAEAAHANGDLDAIAAVIAQAKGYTTTARLIRLENELVAAQAAVIEAVDKLAALHG